MENGNPQKKKLQTSSVISVFVFLADIYFIVNMKSNYAILGVAALATLFVSFPPLMHGLSGKKQTASGRKNIMWI